MGLKETLKQQVEKENTDQEQQSDKDMKAVLEKVMQDMRTLQLKNSMLQSENQKLLSKLTIASEQIESLTSRAASVNATELKNKALLEEAKEAQNMSDEALQKAKRDRAAAERAWKQTELSESRRKKEEAARRDAEKSAAFAKWNAEATKSRYMALFIGIVILAGTLAVLNAYSRRSVLAECGTWFFDRFKGLLSFLAWVESSYIACAGAFSELFGIHAAWGFIIAVVIYLLFASAGVFGVYKLFVFLRGKMGSIKRKYRDGIYKGIITASVSISLFYVCLFCYDSIKSTVPLNIFSVWLLMSLISSALINLKEIVGGLKSDY